MCWIHWLGPAMEPLPNHTNNTNHNCILRVAITQILIYVATQTPMPNNVHWDIFISKWHSSIHRVNLRTCMKQIWLIPTMTWIVIYSQTLIWLLCFEFYQRQLSAIARMMRTLLHVNHKRFINQSWLLISLFGRTKTLSYYIFLSNLIKVYNKHVHWIASQMANKEDILRFC